MQIDNKIIIQLFSNSFYLNEDETSVINDRRNKRFPETRDEITFRD